MILLLRGDPSMAPPDIWHNLEPSQPPPLALPATGNGTAPALGQMGMATNGYSHAPNGSQTNGHQPIVAQQPVIPAHYAPNGVPSPALGQMGCTNGVVQAVQQGQRPLSEGEFFWRNRCVTWWSMGTFVAFVCGKIVRNWLQNKDSCNFYNVGKTQVYSIQLAWRVKDSYHIFWFKTDDLGCLLVFRIMYLHARDCKICIYYIPTYEEKYVFVYIYIHMFMNMYLYVYIIYIVNVYCSCIQMVFLWSLLNLHLSFASPMPPSRKKSGIH